MQNCKAPLISFAPKRIRTEIHRHLFLSSFSMVVMVIRVQSMLFLHVWCVSFVALLSRVVLTSTVLVLLIFVCEKSF
jgi:hypothetical protein